MTAEPDATYVPRVIAARVRLAADDPEGEAEAIIPLRTQTLVELAAEVDAMIAATPLPDVDLPYLIPEDRGHATLSELGVVEYVEDLARPGRIAVVAAEEGTGKSYAIDGELAIRVAAAGGSFAGTWPVLVNGPVLVLSEMHADDDYGREAMILEALGLERPALIGRYYRLPLMTAAGAEPALMSDRWLAWIGEWLRAKGTLLLVVDTATGASQVDPWGKDIQAVYRRLRALLTDCPALAVVLIVHLKKPQGSGERRISDVLGEWGRWCDVLLLLERDGPRTKLSTRKRVRHERRIAATKRDGLLVDPVDLDEAKGTKFPETAVLAVIEAQPGLTYAELARALEVSKATATRYVADLGPRVVVADRLIDTPKGPRRAAAVYLDTALPPHTTSGTSEAVSEAVRTTLGDAIPPQHLTTYIGEVVSREVVSTIDDDYPVSAWESES